MEALESNSDALSKSYDSARRVRPRRNQFRGSCYMEALESKNDALAKSYDSARRVRPCARAPPLEVETSLKGEAEPLPSACTECNTKEIGSRRNCLPARHVPTPTPRISGRLASRI